MDKAKRRALEKQLEQVDTSMKFLTLMVLSLALSWRASGLQAEALCRALEGREGAAADVFSLRLPANAIVVGALTYFFTLALEGWRDTRGTGGRVERSADLNLWAALLVLAAALIRLYDLTCIQGEGGADSF